MSNVDGYLFVLPWKVGSIGGVDQVVINLYRHIAEEGSLAPRILQTSWEDKVANEYVSDGLELCALRLRSPVASSAGLSALVAWLAKSWPELKQIDELLRRHRVKVVNVHFPATSAVQFLLVRWIFRRRFKLIVSFHGSDITTIAASHGIERLFWYQLLKRVDKLVCCSSRSMQLLIDAVPVARNRCVTVHNGLDMARFESERDASARLDSRLEGRPFILSVASYERQKGVDVLIRAFGLSRDSLPTGTVLALAGARRADDHWLMALAEDLGLADQVVFLGEVPHERIHVLYEAATLFCLASRSEAFGLVLLEAGAFRLPVVATRVGGIPEVVTDGVHACLVPSDEPEALAKAITRLFDDPAERTRLGLALHKHVQLNFTWGIASRKYLDLVRELDTQWASTQAVLR